MINKLKRLLKGEGGITGLETAIILIAFVVVAAVFAFTVLSAGVFSSEKGKEAVYSGLGEVAGSVEMRGSVIATASAAGASTMSTVIFTLANVAGGDPIDFHTTNAVVLVEYRDSNERVAITDWTTTWRGDDDGDEILEARELVEITVDVAGNASTAAATNDDFVIEVIPPTGGTLVVERTLPSYLDMIMDLH